MKTVNWGIIGVGDVTEKKSGPAFRKIDFSDLAAVMRRDEAKVKDYARRHNVATYYTDADSLINDPGVNAVYVATPPSSHKEYAIKALRAGKPVYVEKPMAMSYAECLEMLEASEETGQKLFVAYYRRALPYFRRVKQLITEKAIGEVLTAEVRFFRPPLPSDTEPEQHTWRINKAIGGEGYFYDMAPHTLDILDFLLGEIEEAKGFTENRGGYYKVADTVSASFRFANGAIGSGIWCYAGPGNTTEDTVIITGTKGNVRFSTFAFTPIRLIAESHSENYTSIMPEHIQQPLIQTIVNELRGKGLCPSTGVTGARTSKVIDMIFGAL